MALRICKECGIQVAKRAGLCPSCGNPLKTKEYGGCLALIVVATAIFVWIMSDPANDYSRDDRNYINGKTSKVSSNPATKAKISKTLTTVHISNLNEFDWVQPKIYLNGIISGYSYKWRGTVKPYEQLDIGLLNFTNRKSERFQPYKQDIREVMIYVHGFDSNIYKF